MNHYTNSKQIDVLDERTTQDSLFYNTLVLLIAYKTSFKVEECVDIAQRTLAFEFNSFQPSSTDIHNLFVSIIKNQSMGVWERSEFNIKQYISLVRRIGNRLKYNSQMNYYITELMEQLDITNSGLIELAELIIGIEHINDEFELLRIYHKVVNYGMMYGRHSCLVVLYNVKEN